MKAIRIAQYGSSDLMKLEEISKPVLKEGEVLVKVRAAGVNPVDWKIREGLRKDAFPVEFPLTLGQDFAGQILELGPGVTTGEDRYKVGDAVFGFATHGSYAEMAVAKTKNIARMPDSIDFETAASIPTSGLTAWQIVTDAAKVAKGNRVLIHGAAGGVGSFALQISKWIGAHVTATAAKDDAAYLQSLGVDQWIDFKSQRFDTLIKDIDVVIDLIGGDTQKRSLMVLKKGGIIVTTVGGLDGEELAKLGVRGMNFMMKRDSAGLSKLAALVDQRVLKPRVGKVLPLAEAKQAHDLNQSGQSHGKIVLKVA